MIIVLSVRFRGSSSWQKIIKRLFAIFALQEKQEVVFNGIQNFANNGVS